MENSIFKFGHAERTVNQLYIADIELIKGPHLEEHQLADYIKFNDSIFEVPIQIIKVDEKEKKYRLFINLANLSEQKRNDLFDRTRTDSMSFPFRNPSNFKFGSNYKKMIFILDEQGLIDSLPIINLHKVNNKDISINYISDKDYPAILGFDDTLLNHSINRYSTIESQTLRSVLGGQKIGTHIFVSGSWSLIDLVKKVAGSVGYSEAEMQYKAFGEKMENIYCVKCYSYNKKTQSDVVICDHCHTKLDVSRHYSPRLDAYLGYIHLT